MKRICVIMLFVLIGFSRGNSQSKKVLFDNTKAETSGQGDWIIDTHQPIPSPAQSGVTPVTAENYWVGGISAWGIDLVKQGCTVHTLTTAYGITYGNGSNPYDLSNYDMFIVCEPNVRFTSAEKTAIINYIWNGGSLFMVSDHYASDRNSDGWDSPMIWDDLGSDSLFGIHFQVKSESYNNIVQVCTNVSTDPNDSVVHGPAGTATAFSYHNGSTMNMLTGKNPSAAGHIWMNSIARGTTQIVAATARYGAGKVAAVGDSSPADDGTGQSGNSLYTGWTEAGATDNIVFMNMSLWLLNPAPAPPSLPPAPAVLVSPGTGALNLTPPYMLQWLSDSGATTYRLDVSATSLFSSYIFSDSTLTDTALTISGLAPNTTYYWRVRGKNAAGTGVYSAVWDFSTRDLPAQPVYLQPANGSLSTALPVLCVWNQSPAVSAYQIELSTAPDFSAIVFADTTLTDTFKLFDSLALDTKYYWRVRAKNVMGWSSADAGWNFTTWHVPAQILLDLPADNAADIPVPATLRWHIPQPTSANSLADGNGRLRPRKVSVVNQIQYELDLSTAVDFSSFVVADTTLTDSSYVLDSAALGQTFFWRVRAKNQAGWGPFSSVRRFTVWDVPPMVVLISPPDSSLVAGDSLAFRWHAAHAALSYNYELSRSPSFSPLIFSDTARTDTIINVGGLDTGVIYYWHVRGYDLPGWGAFGAARIFHKTLAVTVSDSITAGWRLISVPVIPPDTRTTALFPTATSVAYAYEGNYNVQDTLTPGYGYWLKFGSLQSVSITGIPAVRETIAVAAGWNLLGAPSSPLPVTALTTIPDGILAGPAFGFTTNYFITDSIKPMRGYWLKTTQAGAIVYAVNGGPINLQKSSSGDISIYRNTVAVLDRAGRRWSLLFAGQGDRRASTGIEAPPLPMIDIPDVRFAGGAVALTLGDLAQRTAELKMAGLEYPVTLRWNIGERGSKFVLHIDRRSRNISAAGETVLEKPAGEISIESVSGDIPDMFSLGQNYPNPFNPTTTIRYSLPEDSHVRISIVSVLGQEIATLVDRDEPAGFRERLWDGSSAVSGVYFVRFEGIPLTHPENGVVRMAKIVLMK